MSDDAPVKKNDIAALETVDKADLHIVDLDGDLLFNDDGSKMTITLYSADSERVARRRRESVNRRSAQQQRMGARAVLTAEQLEAEGLAMLVGATDSWNITIGGEKPECTPERVKEVYVKYAHIKDQVDLFMGTRRNFAKASATT